MSEERFERLENMLTDLIRIVGSTNAIVSGLKEDVSGLKEDVSGLKEDVSGLKGDVSGLKGDVSGLKADVSVLKEDMASVKKEQELFRQELFAQSERIDRNHKEVMARLDSLEEKVDYSLQVLQRHDMEIYSLKKKTAV